MAEAPVAVVSPLDHFGRTPENLLFSEATDAEVRLYAVLTTFDYRRGREVSAGRTALVRHTGWSLRKVADTLAKLEARGAIERTRHGRGHANTIMLLADLNPDVRSGAYQIDDGQDPSDDGQNDGIASTSLTRKNESATANTAAPSSRGSSRARARNKHFDALVEVFGPASTPARASFYGKTVRELKTAGATPASIRERGTRLLAKNWDDAGPGALAKHWDALATPNGAHRHDPRGLNADRNVQ